MAGGLTHQLIGPVLIQTISLFCVPIFEEKKTHAITHSSIVSIQTRDNLGYTIGIFKTQQTQNRGLNGYLEDLSIIRTLGVHAMSITNMLESSYTPPLTSSQVFVPSYWIARM